MTVENLIFGLRLTISAETASEGACQQEGKRGLDTSHRDILWFGVGEFGNTLLCAHNS
jgi:hypothetical protein